MRIDRQIQELKQEAQKLQKQIDELESRKKRYIAELTETCPSCHGNGQERYTDAAGSRDTRDCQTCKGIGRIGDIVCECGKVVGTDMIAVRRESMPRCPWCGTGLRDLW